MPKARSESVPDYTTGSLGVTILFGCIVILHGIAFWFLKGRTDVTMWWFKVHGEGLGWKVGSKELPLFRWKVPWLVKAGGDGWKGEAMTNTIRGSKANAGGEGDSARYKILHDDGDRV